MTTEERDYGNNPNRTPANVCIAMPRSGSTLLMRLMAIAGNARVCGDNHIEFYKSLILLTNNRNSCFLQYGNFHSLEKAGVFTENYRYINKEQSERLDNYRIRNILYGNSCDHSFLKTTQVGFANDLTNNFVEMVRLIHESSTPVNIIFLTRDHREILSSFQTSSGPGRATALKEPEMVLDLLGKQEEQFKAAFEFGDIRITYKQLIEDPKKILLRIRPTSYPSDSLVKQVMDKVIR